MAVRLEGGTPPSRIDSNLVVSGSLTAASVHARYFANPWLLDTDITIAATDSAAMIGPVNIQSGTTVRILNGGYLHIF